MDDLSPEQTSVLDRRIREMVDHYPLPRFVTGYDVVFDETWDGDLGTWVMLHLSDGDDDPHEVGMAMGPVLIDMARQLADLVPGRSAFVRPVEPPIRPS